MTTVQRYPAGLLDLLSAKTSGWTPGELGSDLQPTLDLLEMFGLGAIAHVSAQNAAAAEGDSATLTVPATEWWMLYALDQVYEKTATMTLFCGSLRLNAQASNDWVSLASGPVVPQSFGSTPASRVTSCVFVPSRPWLLSPGTQLFSRADILGTDATMNLYINARIARLN